MKEIEFNNKPYRIPEAWNEVTLRMVIDLNNIAEVLPDAPVIALINAYAGIPVQELKASNISVVQDIIKIMDFVNTDYECVPSNEFSFNGSLYLCSPDIVNQSFGDYLAIQNCLYANKDNPVYGLPRMIAIYCKKENETLDDIDVKARTEMFMDLPFTDAKNLEGFFLYNLIAWNQHIQLSSTIKELEKLTQQRFNELINTMKLSAQGRGWYSPMKYVIMIYRKYLLYLKRQLEKYYSSSPIEP